MRTLWMLSVVILGACAAPNQSTDTSKAQSPATNLDTVECEKIAVEVQKSGKTSDRLCGGYMPDGFVAELPFPE